MDDMTPARASRIRAERIEGKRPSRGQLREQEAKAKQAEQDRWTIGRLWAEYKEQHELRGLSQDESRYRLYLEPILADREPDTLDVREVDRLRADLLRKKKPQTVKNVLALLRRILLFGANKGLSKKPSFAIEMPERINNIRTEDLTDQQLARLIKVLNDDPDIQVVNMVRLALVTGMRRGELFRLL